MANRSSYPGFLSSKLAWIVMLTKALYHKYAVDILEPGRRGRFIFALQSPSEKKYETVLFSGNNRLN
jgi:hypothetical protein